MTIFRKDQLNECVHMETMTKKTKETVADKVFSGLFVYVKRRR